MNPRGIHLESPACRLRLSQPFSLQDLQFPRQKPKGVGKGKDERKVKVSASLDGPFSSSSSSSPSRRCHGDQNKASLSPLFWIVNCLYFMVPLLIVASPSQDEDLGFLKTRKKIKKKS